MALLEPYGRAARIRRSRSRPTPRAGSSSCSPRSAATPRSRARRSRFLDYVSPRANRGGVAVASPGVTRSREWSATVVGAAGRPDSRPSARSTPRRSPAQLRKRRHRPGPRVHDRRAGVIARLKAGLDDPQRPVGALLFAGPDRRRQDRARQAARTLPVRRRRAAGARRHERDHDLGPRSPPASRRRRPARASPTGSGASRCRSCCSTRSRRPTTPRSISLLGVIGEGRLTDALGRLVDFRMAVIVMTTNLGAADPRPAGFCSTPMPAPDPRQRDPRFFRPELIGRLDAVVPFRPLPPAALERIVDLELDKLRQRPGFVAPRPAPRALARRTCPAGRARPRSAARRPPAAAHDRGLVVAPLAERMAREPSWRDVTVRMPRG